MISNRSFRSAVAALTCVAAVLAASSARAQPGAAAVTLGFIQRHDRTGHAASDALPGLYVSFPGGRPWLATVDTGSTGTVVAAADIPDFDRLPSLGPGMLTYSSSGRVMAGRWVVTPVTIAGRDGHAVTTRPIAVLAVTRVKCRQAARDCVPSDRPRGIAMLGIGFAREADHQAEGLPSRNAFLNLPAMTDGQLRRGYRLTRDGVQVGLAQGDRHAGFTLVQLVRNAEGTDWAAPPVCITVGDARPACGTLLVDTGVSRMFLTVPGDTLRGRGGDGLPPGTTIRLDLGGAADGSPGEDGASYAFRVGDRLDPCAPSAITLVGVGKRPTFVNTSVHFLAGFEMLYDAESGQVGYRSKADARCPGIARAAHP